MKRALIVAAGRSSRLYPITLELPKGLLPVGKGPNPETLLGRSMRLLREAGVREFCVVVGSRYQQMKAALAAPDVTFVHNPFYEHMNNLGSFWCARQWVTEGGGEPFLYLHSDLAYDGALLRPMMDVSENQALLLTDFGPTDEEAMKVEATAEGFLIRSNKQIPTDRSVGEWVGIAAFSQGMIPSLFPALEEVLWDKQFQAYDTEGFSRMAQRGARFKLVATESKPWIEIDTQEDYERANQLF